MPPAASFYGACDFKSILQVENPLVSTEKTKICRNRVERVTVQSLVDMLDVDFFVCGHQPQEDGFDETLYAAEELALSKALKRWGLSASGGRRLKFIILRKQPHISSGRKFYLYSKREIAALLLRSLIRPRRTVHSRKHLDLFYDGRR